MIDYDENEAGNKKLDYISTASIDLDIDRYTKYKVPHSTMMVMCIKQHLNNI